MEMAKREQDVILQVRDLTKVFDGKTVLDHINFQVERGEFLSILGPSGCGKTTILRILIGLLEPTGGTVELEGADITSAPPDQRSMGIVFQNYALFENMTVLQNVEYALKIKKKTMHTARRTAEEMIQRMNLAEQAGYRPGELSGGQQQRVAIARTLVLNPKIILFDEPMSALDVATRLSLRKEIKKIQAEFGTTMIYITHDQEEAFAMSDRIMVMEKAQPVQLGTPEEIICEPANNYVRQFVIDNLQAKIQSLVKYVNIDKGSV